MEELLDNLWVEKYRPMTLDDIVLDPEIEKKMLEYKEKGSIPHMLFVGTAGIGKSSLAKIISNELLQCETLNINASDEGGIETVRSKVKSFATSASFDGSLKIVILGEADGLSKQAQDSLKEIIEDCSHTTRFILTANDITKLSEPILSRHQRFDIKYTYKDFFLRILKIVRAEGIKGKPAEIEKMCKAAFPDFRSAINNLERYTTNGTFTLPKLSEGSFAEKLWLCIDKEEPEDVRAFVINNTIEYTSHQELMSTMAEYAFTNLKPETSRTLILTLNKYLVQDAAVVDKELNFYCLILELSPLLKNA